MTMTVPAVEVDPFAAAFDKLAELEAASTTPSTPETPAAATPPETPPDPATPATPAATPPETSDPATPATAPAGDQPATPPATPPEPLASPAPAAESDDDIMARFRALLEAAKPSTTSEPPPAAEVEEPALYTQEEQAAVDKYKAEWSEVQAGEALIRKGEYTRLVEHVFRQIAPLAQLVQELAGQQQLQQLESSVTDYDEVRDKVVEWAGKQPAYLRDAYDRVIKQGTADEVVHLIGQWRQATGNVLPPAPTATTTSVPQPKGTELPPATKQVVSELAPVSSKRSAGNVPLNPSDFDSAFDTFAKTLT